MPQQLSPVVKLVDDSFIFTDVIFLDNSSILVTLSALEIIREQPMSGSAYMRLKPADFVYRGTEKLHKATEALACINSIGI